jgi:hypothetical protein
MAAVQPEIIGVFIDDENLGAETQSQHPFPFCQDGLARTDDPHMRVAILSQLGVEPALAGAPAVIRNAVDARTRLIPSLRCLRIAGHQVDRHFGTPRLAEFGQKLFQQPPRPALHQQNGFGVRQPPRQKVAH